jgi:glycosyltransferase involved in cell wall biosynthesis
MTSNIGQRLTNDSRILVTIPTYQKGGVVSFLNAIREHFEGHVEFFSIGKTSCGESVLKMGHRVLTDYVRFYRLLCARPYDLVHINSGFLSKAILRDAVFLLIAKIRGLKTVVFFHGRDEFVERIVSRYAAAVFRSVYGQADLFLVLSSHLRSNLQSMGIRKPIIVTTTVIADDVAAHALGGRVCTSENFTVLFLARVERAKGIYETIQAFSLLRNCISKARLWVAGDGSELSRVKAFVRDHGIQGVEFLGWIDGTDKYWTLLNADVYCLPSYSEGLPVSVLEAIAYGLPVITRPVGGLCDLFQRGRFGYLADEGTPDAIARYLKELAMDATLRTTICKFNRAYARQHFGAKQNAATLEHLYLQVLDGTISSAAARMGE